MERAMSVEDKIRRAEEIYYKRKEQEIPMRETIRRTPREKKNIKLFRKMINVLKDYGLFDVLTGVLVGKPQNETYYDEYKSILLEELSDKNVSIVYNVNVGHATPRCIIPFGVEAEVNVKEQVITFNY